MDSHVGYRISDHGQFMMDSPSYNDVFGEDDYHLDDNSFFFDPATCAARSKAARDLLASGPCVLDKMDTTQTIMSPNLSYTSTPVSSTRSVSSDCDSDADAQYSFDADADFSLASPSSYVVYPQQQQPPRVVVQTDMLPPPTIHNPFAPDQIMGDDDKQDSFNDGLEEPPPTPSVPEPFLGQGTQDDTAVKQHPSGRVDYLAHEWELEELWASHRYVRTRVDELPDGHRLENASWRSWSKSMHNLKTVTAESLNWLKDCDTTWLYGPIIADKPASPTYSSYPSKRPILKRRSMSEIMLARSLSMASLLKDATAAVQAQEARPSFQRTATTDAIMFPGFVYTSGLASNVTSNTSSGLMSPSTERRRIQFNECVTQCIAIDQDDGADNDNDDDDHYNNYHEYHGYSSDDDSMTMKRPRAYSGNLVLSRSKRRKSSDETRIIAMLPSTTLKAKALSAPAPVDDDSCNLFRSSSQETLRPSSKPSSSNFLFADDDYDMDPSDDWQMPDFSGGYAMQDPGLSPSPASSEEPAGMRRTSSGMFMPIDDDDRPEGLIGRVLEAVNTAKDIGHVIWNVGWSGR